MSIFSLFFNQHEPILPSKALFTDVGGNFLSLAIALTDLLIVKPKNSCKFLSEKLLERHFSNFKEARNSTRLFQSLSTEGLIKFIPEFAYTLKHFALEEIDDKPLYYRQAFKSNSLRDDLKFVNRELIAALASSIGLLIIIQCLRSKQDLPLNLCYGSINSQAKISLACLPKNYYIPKLYQPERYKMITTELKSDIRKDFAKPKTEDFIAKQELLLIKDYENLCAKLSLKLKTGEKTEAELRSLYFKSLTTKAQTANNMNYVDSECGSQKYFEALLASKMEPAFANFDYANKDSLELVCAVSRAISLGQIDRASLELGFEQSTVLSI